MKKTLLVLSLLVFVALTISNTGATLNNYEYNSVPLLTYPDTGYTVNYGHTLTVTISASVVWHGNITAQLFLQTETDWQLIKHQEYSPLRDTKIIYVNTTMRRYTWTSFYIFPSVAGARSLTVIFHWFDNLNLTNWVGMAGASLQINATHWEHQVRWSETFTFPDPPPRPKLPVQHDYSFIILIGGLVGLAVFGGIILYLKKRYGAI